MYEKGIEQMINISGVVMFYYPFTEYSLTSLTQLWGEDMGKKFLEKYTIKGITEGENDNFAFNRFGVDKTTAERTVWISRKSFREILGRDEPREGEFFMWTQNNIIYEIIEVTDQDNIVLGMEMTWKLVATPRMIEGEVMGLDNCDPTREQVIDMGQTAPVKDCDQNLPATGDGSIVTDPNVIVPGPTPHKEDDEKIIDRDKNGAVIRNGWGNW